MLTFFACSLQSLIKTLVGPLDDHNNLDRPGCIFLSKKWMRSWNRPSVSGEKAAMILLKCTNVYVSISIENSLLHFILYTHI